MIINEQLPTLGNHKCRQLLLLVDVWRNSKQERMLNGMTKFQICNALRAFGEAVKDCRTDDAALPWPPMLPFVYPKYWESKMRIFYIGRDTYGWGAGDGNFSYFFCKYDERDFGGYMDKNSSVLRTESRIGEWAGCTGSFWHVVNLLHLRIRFGRIADLNNLSVEEKDALDEIGYGNLNSIEIPQTLQKEGCWERIDKDKYWAIKNASNKFLDKYKLLLDAYAPQISIITSWSGDEASYFEGLRYERIVDETEGKLKVWVYKVSNGNQDSIVIWTCHPSYLPRISVNRIDFVEKISTIVLLYK